jgi:hypothetical protein
MLTGTRCDVLFVTVYRGTLKQLVYMTAFRTKQLPDIAVFQILECYT